MRLVRKSKVLAYPYKGYWSPADTVKERIQLDERFHRADCPWMIWDPDRSGRKTAPSGSLPTSDLIDSSGALLAAGPTV